MDSTDGTVQINSSSIFDEVMPISRKNQDDIEFNMNHPNRGYAVVFSYEKFNSELELEDRPETKLDVKKFKNSLLHLGFTNDNIIICENYTAEETLNQVKEVADKNHSDNDCLIVAVFTHGDEDKMLYATDKGLSETELWEPFFGDKCRTLVGKPKIFVIQACRGGKLDDGVLSYDEPDFCKSYAVKIPMTADTLKCYAAFPDYYAWRRNGLGSIYIHALSEIIQWYGYEKDFFSILTEVNRQVAIGFESCHNDEDYNEKKQMPTFESSLTKILRFKPKNHIV